MKGSEFKKYCNRNTEHHITTCEIVLRRHVRFTLQRHPLLFFVFYSRQTKLQIKVHHIIINKMNKNCFVSLFHRIWSRVTNHNYLLGKSKMQNDYRMMRDSTDREYVLLQCRSQKHHTFRLSVTIPSSILTTFLFSV